MFNLINERKMTMMMVIHLIQVQAVHLHQVEAAVVVAAAAAVTLVVVCNICNKTAKILPPGTKWTRKFAQTSSNILEL